MEDRRRDIFLRAMDILYAGRLKKYGLDACFTAVAVYAGGRPDVREAGANGSGPAEAAALNEKGAEPSFP